MPHFSLLSLFIQKKTSKEWNTSAMLPDFRPICVVRIQ